MLVATNLVAGTAALAVALAADPPPLAPGNEIPGGYLDSEDLLGSEPDDGQNKITLGSILFSLGGLRLGAGVVGYLTASPDSCAQRYGASVSDNTCAGLRIYGIAGMGLGGLMAVSGVAILATGLVQRQKHRAWLRERGMAFGPWLGPHAQGLSFGLRF